jgi:hypothetical protein
MSMILLSASIGRPGLLPGLSCFEALVLLHRNPLFQRGEKDLKNRAAINKVALSPASSQDR